MRSKKPLLDEQIKLTFLYSNQSRVVQFSDIIALLYERGLDDLAKELVKRSDWAFTLLDRKIAKNQFTATTTWKKADMEDIIPKPKKKWWQI